VEALDNM